MPRPTRFWLGGVVGTLWVSDDRSPRRAQLLRVLGWWRYLYRISSRSAIAFRFVVHCSCCFNHKSKVSEITNPQIPLLTPFLCVEGLQGFLKNGLIHHA
jgi:hypothetical protein